MLTVLHKTSLSRVTKRLQPNKLLLRRRHFKIFYLAKDAADRITEGSIV